MSWFLVMIPVLMLIGSILMYRFIGRGEVFRFDIVQFFYAFILTPIAFVWSKVLLFLLLKNNLVQNLSDLNYLLIDNGFSVVFLYIFGFEMVHSLTKTVSLNVSRDPLYDVFGYLEYFHLWLTHLIIFGGGMLIMTILSLVNLFFPLELQLSQFLFYSFVGSGLISGGLIFVSLWLSDPKQEKGFQFMRIMKILIGLLFIIQVGGFFLKEPGLTANYLMFWWSALNFTSLVTCAFLSYRSVRVKSWLARLVDRFKHPGFDFRIQL
ncbi:MAG TPA: hypothetical protein DEP87_00695 [Candidatus Pacebacteria bacterium]|nr:hypothetical protein [Candidatus Paceibacterota bacterium]